jgi:PPP family 3-phenylpropionic acid transporter
VFQFGGYHRPEIEGSIVVAFLVVAAAFVVAVIVLPRAQVDGAKHATDRGGRLPREFWLVITIVFLTNTGFSAHSAFFSLYVQDMLPGFLVSGAWAIGAAAEIPVILFGGSAVRRVGIRMLLIVATVGTTVRLLVYAFAPQTVPVLGAQLLHAFTFGALHTAGMSFVARAVAPGARGRAVSLYNAIGYGLPGLLGGILGGQILEYLGFSTLFLVFAIPPAVGALIAARRGDSIERKAGSGWEAPKTA